MGGRLSGSLPLARLSRLAGLLSDREGRVEVELSFARDSKGRATLRGRVSGDLHLICQRCLGTLVLPVEGVPALVLVARLGEAEGLENSVEPLVVGEGPLVVADVVEDELILAIPQVPMHPIGSCQAGVAPIPAAGDGGAGPRASPFAVLEGLRDRRKK